MWHPQSRYTRPGPSKSSAPQILFLIFLLIEGLASLTISTLATYGLTTFATNPPVRETLIKLSAFHSRSS